jgi:hypothetical protein
MVTERSWGSEEIADIAGIADIARDRGRPIIVIPKGVRSARFLQRASSPEDLEFPRALLGH